MGKPKRHAEYKQYYETHKEEMLKKSHAYYRQHKKEINKKRVKQKKENGPPCNMDCFNCILKDCIYNGNISREAKAISDALGETKSRSVTAITKAANQMTHQNNKSKVRICQMKNYDPNIYESTHVIRVTLQEWEYKGHIAFKMGGNCKGADILESGLSFPEFDGADDISRYVENDCNFAYNGDGEEEGWYSCTLKDGNGDTCEVNDLETDDVKRMIVAVEIVDCKGEDEPNEN